MDVVELDDLRHQLRISQRDLCARVALHPSTYSRWRKYLRGEPGGSMPQVRSLHALRAALKAAVRAVGAET